MCSILLGWFPEDFREAPQLLSGLAHPSVGMGIGYLREGALSLFAGESSRLSLPPPLLSGPSPCMFQGDQGPSPS